jgi:hypothetical protein
VLRPFPRVGKWAQLFVVMALLIAMHDRFSHFKPGVGKRTHLAATALLWTVAGAILMVRGLVILSEAGFLWCLVVALGFGLIKSTILLDGVARRAVTRIQRFGERTCIGAVYSWKTWVLVLAMICMGIIVRRVSLPPPLVGTVVFGIGFSLLLSSRHGWGAWRDYPEKTGII